jgi:hypothetical protein
VQTVFVAGVFWKLNIDLFIDFSEGRFFLKLSIGFTLIDFGRFSSVKLK